ncbi:MAG: hypothetical protein D6820_11180, partial [Lentisphaerae bacterium]
PEYILLDWHRPRSIRGCIFLIGAFEGGAGKIIIQRHTGNGAPDETDDCQWQTITTITPYHPWRPPLCWETVADFGKDVTTRALRFVFPAGLPKSQSGRGEVSAPGEISLGEILVLQDLHRKPVPAAIRRRRDLPEGVVPITFHMPQAGKASIRIVDSNGQIIKNLVNGQSFSAGKQTVWWDLSTIDDYFPPFALPAHPHYRKGALSVGGPVKIAHPGNYRWEGIWHPEFKLEYLYSYYPLKKHNLAWITADTTGGWLGDHSPPRTIVRVNDKMWVGTFCEAGHAILESDLDMKKLWGSNRLWLACPRVLAAANGKVYYLEQGGWARKIVMIEIDTRTKRARRLLARDKRKDEPLDIQGLAVVGERAFYSNRAANQVVVLDISANLKARPHGFSWKTVYKVLDHEKMTVIKTLNIPSPGRIRPYDSEHLALISGKQVLLLDLNTYRTRPLIRGLTNPGGLAIDEHKNIYVGEMAPIHQVKVFSPRGKLLRTIGKRGPHKIGVFDPDNLESPAGVEVDANGNVWVCEFNQELKRTSVWNRQGKCINQVLGPTVYGGGGDIDPHNENRFFYKGKEFLRDPKTGKIRLVKIIWRSDNPAYDLFFEKAAHNFGGAAPAYPFYHNGKLFFTSWQGWAAAHNIMIWLYDRDHVRPVAAIGTIPDWLRQRVEGRSGDPKFGKKVASARIKRIDFTWGGAPAKGVKRDNFAVRITGELIVPTTGRYTLFTDSDDGVRLLLDNKPVITNWTDHGTTEDKAEIDLSAGSHKLRIDFYDKIGGARLRLKWQGPGIPKQTVPASALRNLRIDYYNPGFDTAICSWTDRNEDGRVQKEEVEFATILFNGEPWNRCGAGWQFRMNANFETAVTTTSYNNVGIAFIRPKGFTSHGYPIFKLPREFKRPPYPYLKHSADAVFTDRKGNAIALLEYIISMNPDGRVNWRYKNRWPGLHAGHHTSARGDEPGVVIAPTRFFGSGIANDTIGEVFCIGSNLGTTYLFTADGFFVDRVFQDTRVGLSWHMNRPPTPEILARMSLGDEHFGGTLNYVRGNDGRYHFRYVVGKTHCSVIELHGLENIQKLPGGSITVTAADLARAEKLRQLRARKKMQRKEYTIARARKIVIDGKDDEWPTERIDGFALAY